MAEENKNLNKESNTNTSKQNKVFTADSFSNKNQKFPSLKDFQSKLELFKNDNDKFWQQESEKLLWIKNPIKIKAGKGLRINWFVGSKSNISLNCIDRHLTTETKNKAALIWESEHGKNWILTYQLLYSYVCRTANAIKKLGLKKGCKALIICGSLPETVFSVLACARIGITFSVLNPNISTNALSKRIEIGNFELIIAADAVYRKGNLIEIKNKVDDALNKISLRTKKLIFRRVKNYDISLNPEVDFLASDIFENVPDQCKPVSLDNNFPLFSVFDYDDNGNLIERFFPAAGFMAQTLTSSIYSFDFSADDIFWCNGDLSSVAGLTYGIFAPLLNGISTFIYEGLPNFPIQDRMWKLIGNYKITKLFSEAYILKALLSSDEVEISSNDVASLRMISVFGNPISENDWGKIFTRVCKEKIPLTNCFITNQIASIVFSDIPGITDIYPGYYNSEFPLVPTEVVNSKLEPIENDDGILVFNNSFPAYLKKNLSKSNFPEKLNNKFIVTNYVANRNGNKVSIIKRIDNKLEIAGELVSLKEIQSVIEAHPKVKSCKVDYKSDPILYFVPVALVELHNSQYGTLLLKEELRNLVEQNISIAAKPGDVIFTN